MMDHLRHLFLPHHTNNYRAKVLHLDFFVLYVVTFLSLALTLKTVHRVNPDILGFATDIHVDQLVGLTNQKRVEAGVGTLKLNATLSQAAAGKAADMFGKDYWAHNAPDGTTPWTFIHGAGYSYIVAGENLAKNFSDSTGVVEAWMNSPSHRENLLRDQYEDVGFAVVNGRLGGEETTLVVQMFGKQLAGSETPEIAANPFSAQAATLESSPEPLPTTTPTSLPIAQIIPSSPPKNQVELGGVGGAVIKRPLFNISSISKNSMFTLAFVLSTVLVIDGIYVWRKRIVRVGGRNSAHLLFLFGITGFVYLLSFGSIL